MENYILNRKLVEIEKHKEYSFRIPTMFNAAACEFILEVSPEHLPENLTVEFTLRNPTEPSANNLKVIRVYINKAVTRFMLIDMPEIEARDYLLFGGKANQTCSLALSIIES